MKGVDTLIELIKLIVRKIYFGVLLLTSVGCSIFSKRIVESDQDQANKYASLINKQDLFLDLNVLASDSLEGRETATKGQKKAAEYIKNHFINNNIKSAFDTSYYQQYEVNVTDFTNVSLSINGEPLELIEDFYVFGNPQKTNYKNTKVTFVGYGIENSKVNYYENRDVEGNVVLIKDGVPELANPYLYSSSDANWRNKVKSAAENGAIAAIFMLKDFDDKNQRIKEHILNPRMKMHNSIQVKKSEIPVFFISEKVYQQMTTQKPYTFKDKKRYNEIFKVDTKVSFHTDVNNIVKAENVLGYIPGKNNEEVLVISAHYDHIGFDRGEICNGADDDGSGTAALLSISKAFQKAFNDGIQPERSVLFLSVSGEEKGLFGSKYYTDNPVFDLNKTVANLNIDMVGRRDTIQEDDNYIYLIGSDKISKDLHQINEQVNKKHIGFKLDYTYNDEKDPNMFYYRSDHYNFAKNNIPVIFYFGGLHEDYHKPSDEIDKINFSKLEKVSQYVFLTAWELANRKTSLK